MNEQTNNSLLLLGSVCLGIRRPYPWGLQEFRTLYLEVTLVKKCLGQLKLRGGLILGETQIQGWQLDFQLLASAHGSPIPAQSGHRTSLMGFSHLPGTPEPLPYPTVVILCRGRNCLGRATLRKDDRMPSYLLVPFRGLLPPTLLSLPLLLL